jgi:hypothetical protein
MGKKKNPSPQFSAKALFQFGSASSPNQQQDYDTSSNWQETLLQTSDSFVALLQTG